MEESKNNSSMGCGGKMCSCGCGCGWASGHRLFRVVLALVIALVVFWIGVKVGEFSTLMREYRGYGMRGVYPMQVYSGGGGMMGQYYGDITHVAVPGSSTTSSAVQGQ